MRRSSSEILGLSLEHRLLTPYTAFVAVDEARVTGGGAAKRVAVPVEVPEAARGVTLQGYGTGASYGYGGGGGVSAGTIGGGSFGYSSGSSAGTIGTIGYGSGTGSGSGYARGGMRARSAEAPMVEMSMPSVVAGSLDKSIIRRYIRRRLAQITYCYEKLLISTPKLAGTVTASFTIAEDGHVASATATGMNHPELESCIAGIVKSIEFPSAEHGGVVQVTYPFTFKVSKEAP